MKTSELRIGNLLFYKGTDQLATVHLINGANHFDCRDEFGSFTPNGNYEPIPLTEELLSRLGLVHDGILYSASDEIQRQSAKDIGVKTYSFFFNTRLNRWMECQTRVCVDYVHQAQNLVFALTGQELTLNT